MSVEAFQLTSQRVLLSHLNIRSENHGKEQATAIDIKFEYDTANNLLSKLHPDLRATYYKKDEGREDLASDDHLPSLRFKLLDPTIGWELEVPRTLLRIHGAKPEDDIVLSGGKTNGFKLTMKEGGTVNWKIRCQYSKPPEHAIEALSRLLQQNVVISLECAEEEQKDLFKEAEQVTEETKSAARLKAEQEFEKIGHQVDELPATVTTEQKEEAPATEAAPESKPRSRGKRSAGAANLE